MIGNDKFAWDLADMNGVRPQIGDCVLYRSYSMKICKIEGFYIERNKKFISLNCGGLYLEGISDYSFKLNCEIISKFHPKYKEIK